MMDAVVEADGAHAMREEDLCIAVGEDLAKHYPGHPWMVGVLWEAGTVCIDLGYRKPEGLRNMAYLLHIPGLCGPGGQQRVMRAGGELLERWGLPRAAAGQHAHGYAIENGLDVTGGKK